MEKTTRLIPPEKKKGGSTIAQQRQGCLRALSSALRGLRPNVFSGWLGRSHCVSGWRKSKSLAEARNLFAGPQRVIHGMLLILFD
jgi:hypothetical protein